MNGAWELVMIGQKQLQRDESGKDNVACDVDLVASLQLLLKCDQVAEQVSCAFRI